MVMFTRKQSVSVIPIIVFHYVVHEINTEFISHLFDRFTVGPSDRISEINDINQITASSIAECAMLCLQENTCSQGNYKDSEILCLTPDSDLNSGVGLNFLRRIPDGCQGCVWFEDSWYQFFHNDVIWQKAVDNCQSRRGKLVELETAAENNFIKEQMKSGNMRYAWIGAYDFDRTHTYRWISNPYDKMSFKDFGDGEPNHINELCLMLHEDYSFMWIDMWCSANGQFICEYT